VERAVAEAAQSHPWGTPGWGAEVIQIKIETLNLIRRVAGERSDHCEQLKVGTRPDALQRPRAPLSARSSPNRGKRGAN
jgi:hypothetical protein